MLPPRANTVKQLRGLAGRGCRHWGKGHLQCQKEGTARGGRCGDPGTISRVVYGRPPAGRDREQEGSLQPRGRAASGLALRRRAGSGPRTLSHCPRAPPSRSCTGGGSSGLWGLRSHRRQRAALTPTASEGEQGAVSVLGRAPEGAPGDRSCGKPTASSERGRRTGHNRKDGSRCGGRRDRGQKQGQRGKGAFLAKEPREGCWEAGGPKGLSE